MAFSIKNEATDQLARRLARETGESLTDAVTIALRERLERVSVDFRTHRPGESVLSDLVDELAAMPDLDPRSPDEILGYDERGLPGRW
ncbi:MAG: type II toxin-antitoxin system VapB family antitoxin [Acidobacteria bacterium]|nr:type II toxin-antitoxin system VapB family antitoxin [Acidobacteriota bacterium]